MKLSVIALLLVIGLGVMGRATTGAEECEFDGIPLYGRVQFVESFPDITVQVVDAFPELRVQIVDAFPDQCGEWQEVDSFPDFTVQIVDAFPGLGSGAGDDDAYLGVDAPDEVDDPDSGGEGIESAGGCVA